MATLPMLFLRPGVESSSEPLYVVMSISTVVVWQVLVFLPLQGARCALL